MDLHVNLIDGEWVEGKAVPDVNPGQYRRGGRILCAGHRRGRGDRRREGGVSGQEPVGAG